MTNSRNKILFLVSAIGNGGAERVAVQLANFLSLNNFQVEICYWNSCENEYPVLSSVKLNYVSCRFRWLAVAKTIRRFRPDILLSFTDVANVIMYLSKVIASEKPIHIPTVHSDLAVRDKNMDFGFRTKILKSLHKYVCQKSNKVVVVSDGARKSLINYYELSSSQCIRIYNPVMDERHFDRRPALSGPAKTDNELKLKIVAAGRLTLAKNYPLLLKVAKKLKDHNFNFSIDIFGTGELLDEISGLIKENELNEHVYLRGFVDNLSATLNEYDLFLMTSSWEGFGNVLVEALDARLNIISTDCSSGPKEILADGRFGALVPVGEVSPIVDSILNKSYIVNINPEELNTHLHSFTLSAIGNEYLDLFKTLR